jgi:hypothetical protein
MAMRFVITVLAVTAAGSSALAWDQYPFDSYLQRSDTMTLGAGNAKATNSVTHMINPWPPYVMDRRITSDGQRMVGAVERYRDVARINRLPCPIIPQFEIATTGVRSGTATQCGGGAPIVGTGTTTMGAGGNSTSITAPVYGQ